MCPLKRVKSIPGFAALVQAHRNTPPKQVRHPTDRQFASGYSPPRLATTQLPSATELWPTPTGTYTLQIARFHGRTVDRSRGRGGSDQAPAGASVGMPAVEAAAYPTAFMGRLTCWVHVRAMAAPSPILLACTRR